MANYKGFYNVYNILAAYAGIRTAGFKAEHFNEMLRKFNPENGRNEQFRIKGTSVVLNLAKNPAGFNQNISAVMQDGSPKDIIIVINDNAQDGKDMWISRPCWKMMWRQPSANESGMDAAIFMYL